MGILRAIIDAIMGPANEAGGRAVTKLSAALDSTDTTMSVESTLRFGEWGDGTEDCRLLVDGEIVTGTGRTSSDPFTFTGLTRGVDGTNAKAYPIGTLVLDLAGNSTAIDLVRRGFFVDFAVGADLDVIARNLGLRKCPGIDTETWRRIIKAVAYLPKTTVDAFEQALLALTDDASTYTIIERLISNPYEVFVEIEASLAVADAEGVRGRFILTGGSQRVTDGLTQVTLTGPNLTRLQTVSGVYLDTEHARRGIRDGLTNYLSSFVAGSDVITLSPSPGAIGTAVIVDYVGYGGTNPTNYHYLGTGFGADQINLAYRYDPGTTPPALGADGTSIQTVRLDDGDRWAYLSDSLLAARCLLDDIRQAGVRVSLSAGSPSYGGLLVTESGGPILTEGGAFMEIE